MRARFGTLLRACMLSGAVAVLAGVLAAAVLAGCAGPQSPGPRPSEETPTGGPPSITETVPVAEWPDEIEGFEKPTSIVAPGDGSPRLYVTEQRGIIRLVKNGKLEDEPALDLRNEVGSSASEQGLLCIAFPPGYAEKGYAYLDFTDEGGDTRVCRIGRSSSDPDRFDPDTLQVLLRIDQPYTNHNGGQLAFGPDGYLYVGMGDGGSAGDPQNRAQNRRSLLGKILRIDVESSPAKEGYDIPKGNPFADGSGGRPEIWLLGLRNPWRFSFDPETGNIWIADVGQNGWEEIDTLPPGTGGANLGWALYEGNHRYKASSIKREGYWWPVDEYSRSEGISVTGGYVYRGRRYPDMQGLYVFADFGSGRIWTLEGRSDGSFDRREVEDTDWSISTFGIDGDGELWAADWSEGVLHRIGDLSR